MIIKPQFTVDESGVCLEENLHLVLSSSDGASYREVNNRIYKHISMKYFKLFSTLTSHITSFHMARGPMIMVVVVEEQSERKMSHRMQN